MFYLSIFPIFRHLQSTGKDNPSAQKVDRLVLHQSSPSPSLSNSSHSEQNVELHLKNEDLSTPLSLKRPETSRGRLVRTSNTQREDIESPLCNRESSPEEELGWSTRRDRERKERGKEEEEKRERPDWEISLREKKEEKEREKREAEKDLEEEREKMLKEKEKRLRLLKEELREEEEEEERRLKKESEERRK